MSDRPKLLLTSVTRPFGKRHGDGFSTTASALYQMMWAQDVFRIDDPAYHWGLDVIANNIDFPSVVYHYPTLSELAAELRRNRYDYVGISFNPPTLHKMKKMVPVIRKWAPDAKIILGGFGTALSDEELDGYYDLLCREEGITFFRKLLNQPLENGTFKTPPVIFTSHLFSLPLLGKTAPIFGGVGCANGCDFCMTSHFFKRKHHQFLKTGGDIVQAILDVKKVDPEVESFVVYDEDLLLNKKRGQEFLEACRDTDERFAISAFGSVKALSQYDPETLAEMGVSSIWVGFEGLKCDYDKQKGKSYKQLFDELKSVGIAPAASMIIGFDYQTVEIIEQEFTEFLKLQPAISQFLIYGPSRGSPFYDRMEQEDRLNDVSKYLYAMQDGFTLAFEHPKISAPTMKLLARQLYRGEYQFLGPTIYRTLDISLRGYRALKNSSSKRLQVRAEMQKDFLRNAQAARTIGILMAPNNLVRHRVERTFEEIEKELGPAPTLQELQNYAVLPLGLWTKFKYKYDLFSQVGPRRTEYNLSRQTGLGAVPDRIIDQSSSLFHSAAARVGRLFR